MKKLLFASIALGLLAIVCCQDESGIEKEKKAIKAVIEGEKSAYYRQDLASMDNAWVQEPSSRKLFMTPHGITELEGWDQIHQNHLEESERERTDLAETAQFTNYSINIYGNTALVHHDSHHKFIVQNEQSLLKMKRIVHMVKIEGEWKIDLMAMYFHPDTPMMQGIEP
jgi:hypothetical protein